MGAKKLGPKIFLVKRIFGSRKCWVKKCWVQENFGSKWVKKMSGPNKFWVQENVGPKYVGAKKVLGPKNIQVEKKFG